MIFFFFTKQVKLIEGRWDLTLKSFLPQFDSGKFFSNTLSFYGLIFKWIFFSLLFCF